MALLLDRLPPRLLIAWYRKSVAVYAVIACLVLPPMIPGPVAGGEYGACAALARHQSTPAPGEILDTDTDPTFRSPLPILFHDRFDPADPGIEFYRVDRHDRRHPRAGVVPLFKRNRALLI